ncbi:aldose 1-epimerase [Cohnella cholangitidis]|uniref:Aldose 1-epimerase n=1 Tax=Cohnella cholangitidis TaxID=2598458 RepID=A0A7G5C282_9BACL|nr:aldose 1-epimerase [Cohnella cholangitidis]QMV43316.1 aldose 1-epimerase [Cohnella cholangitidis]
MSRYAANRIIKDGMAVIELTDAGSDSVAEIVPEVGNNLYRFESGGRQVLVPPASVSSFKDVELADFQYGTPILFPPNRVKDGRMSYKGREYHLPLNEPPHFHLHGEICSKAWEVVETGASEERGAYAISRFRYAAHPAIMAYFPHPLTFTVTVSLREGRLEMNGTIANEGQDEAPLAFGLHPYFAIPFGNGEEIRLQVPATAEWPVTNLALVAGKPEVTAYSRSLSEGVSIADYPQLGCNLLTLAGGDSTCRMEMKDRGYTIAYRFGPEFPYVLLFRPDWSSAYSLEPYTYVTDAFNLPYEHEWTGARGIAAGETFRFSTSMWVE